MTPATPERLYLLNLGIATLGTDADAMKMSAWCYLIQMSDGQNILIDTGLPSGFAPPGAARLENEKNVLEHLADLALRPEDIDILICTHFDIDHIGHHEAFTNAECIVQRQHYELARGGHERYAGRARWDHPALHYRLVDGDTELFPGVTLIETSGHVPGHQSVLVRLPKTGPVLLAIDAVMLQHLFTAERTAWSNDDNPEQLRISTQKLLDLVERERVGLVVFGHDGQQWETLKTAPEYYE